MIPNDFGLIRQKDHTLFALLFPYISDVSEMQIEARYISSDEWTEGEFYNSASGNIVTDRYMKHAIIDVSKYDYVLLPCSTLSTPSSVYSGLTISDSTINMAYRSPLTPVSHQQSSYVFYNLLGTDYKYAITNQAIDDNMPIIGIFRHRSDQVNPKGIIKDVNSNILQPIKADKLDSEAERERDELSGNTESPDLDSESGVGADERADG